MLLTRWVTTARLLPMAASSTTTAAVATALALVAFPEIPVATTAPSAVLPVTLWLPALASASALSCLPALSAVSTLIPLTTARGRS